MQRNEDAEDVLLDLEIVENADRVAGLLTRPGTSPQLIDAIFAVGDDEPPNDEPHHAEMIEAWIGRPNLDALIRDAISVFKQAGQGHAALYSALTRLEPPDSIEPTASLHAEIERHQIALEVLREMFGRAGEAMTNGATWMMEYGGDALLKSGALIQKRIELLQQLRNARLASAEQLRAATKQQHGARGDASEPARIRRFMKAAAPLSAAKWNRSKLATLVIASAGWNKPPCPRFVQDLLEATGTRDVATVRLAGRIHDAERRAR